MSDADASPVRRGGTFELLTSPGPAAIATLRLRGPAVPTFLDRHLRLHRSSAASAWNAGAVRRADLLNADGVVLDDILVSVHATPPMWDIRLHLHGSPWVVRRCTELLAECGLAESREPDLTLWPAADLIEAEAYALLPRMLTWRGVQWLLAQVPRLRAALAHVLTVVSLDEQRARCREYASRAHVVDWFTQPARIVLIGPPNSGKSTLANALADHAVSLVSPHPGTTRDWIDVSGQLAGFPVLWTDTAGVRHSDDLLETASIVRTHELARTADAIVLVLDATLDPAAMETAILEILADLPPACIALNKADLAAPSEAVLDSLPPAWRPRVVSISALNRTGLDALTPHVLAALYRDQSLLNLPSAFTPRQAALLSVAAEQPDKNWLMNQLNGIFDTRAHSAAPPTSTLAGQAGQPI